MMRSKERNPIFLAYLLVIMAAIAWFTLAGRGDDKDQVRIAAVGAMSSIAARDPDGICQRLSPKLIQEIYQSDFQALAGIPQKDFCVLAAKAVFSLYGDYYISAESMGRMVLSKIQVKETKPPYGLMTDKPEIFLSGVKTMEIGK